MDKWTKYSYTCDPDECDSLTEFTCKDTFGFPSGSIHNMKCPCGRHMTLVSVEDATILPTTTKEEQMETTLNEQIKNEYDLAHGNIITELENKLATHQNCDYWKSEHGRIGSQIIELIKYSYDNESDAEEILTSLAEIIDYNPVKEIHFTAMIQFSGRIDVPMNELNSFDLTDALSDAYVDINDGNIVIDDCDIYECDEA